MTRKQREASSISTSVAVQCSTASKVPMYHYQVYTTPQCWRSRVWEYSRRKVIRRQNNCNETKIVKLWSLRREWMTDMKHGISNVLRIVMLHVSIKCLWIKASIVRYLECGSEVKPYIFLRKQYEISKQSEVVNKARCEMLFDGPDMDGIVYPERLSTALLSTKYHSHSETLM